MGPFDLPVGTCWVCLGAEADPSVGDAIGLFCSGGYCSRTCAERDAPARHVRMLYGLLNVPADRRPREWITGLVEALVGDDPSEEPPGGAVSADIQAVEPRLGSEEMQAHVEDTGRADRGGEAMNIRQEGLPGDDRAMTPDAESEPRGNPYAEDVFEVIMMLINTVDLFGEWYTSDDPEELAAVGRMDVWELFSYYSEVFRQIGEYLAATTAYEEDVDDVETQEPPWVGRSNREIMTRLFSAWEARLSEEVRAAEFRKLRRAPKEDGVARAAPLHEDAEEA